MKLIALLPKDRTKLGTLQAISGSTILCEWPCYAKADNFTAKHHGNPTRDPEKKYGDTPLGNWNVKIGEKQTDTAAYGVHPVIVMLPIDGPALRAYQIGERSGIWLHGGKLNASGQLRPTFGCIRVHDSTMAELLLLAKKHGSPDTLETKEIKNV
jgi:hypothetical protein